MKLNISTRHEEAPSLFTRISGALLFCFFVISSFAWFFVSITALVSDLASEQPVLTFSKGAMYMLGAGIGASFFSVGVVYYSLYARKVPEKCESILIKGVLVGIVIMFLFPQIAHFSIKEVVDVRKYVACKEAEYSWLMYKKYVYTENERVCKRLIKGN